MNVLDLFIVFYIDLLFVGRKVCVFLWFKFCVLRENDEIFFILILYGEWIGFFVGFLCFRVEMFEEK